MKELIKEGYGGRRKFLQDKRSAGKARCIPHLTLLFYIEKGGGGWTTKHTRLPNYNTSEAHVPISHKYQNLNKKTWKISHLVCLKRSA
jgi:hypothetical protein